ncbi:protein gpr107 [Plakobranchus ocellatus]|uniref:Protein gpr107 n=1 Tax=Plakobranchus ocellatus TaxID=259542 RepID=A0AAV3Z177_9GAST|nr:protein gpr107 [Plakobranchus ocellatus]
MLTRTFGFLKDGTLTVNVTMFSCRPHEAPGITNTTFGFTLNKSKNPGLASYMEDSPACVLDKPDGDMPSVFFRLDLEAMKLIVERNGKDLHDLTISNTPRELFLFENGLAHGAAPLIDAASAKTMSESKNTKTSSSATSQETMKANATAASSDSFTASERQKREATEDESSQKQQTIVPSKILQDKKEKLPKASILYFPLTQAMEGSMPVYRTYFIVHFRTEQEEGLYNIFFHNCQKQPFVNLTLQIIQDNNGNYLSADEMPIPVLYFMFSIVYFILTAIWYSVLRKAEEGVFKIHYMMLIVVLFKAFSCLFHGVNMHMIQLSGIHVDAWAILWYIVYLMRGAFMFVTVLLIGAGWAFIKHVFTDREKKLFLVIIPLQILMNVAWVIVEESEQGDASYNTWNKIFIVVDLLCCFAILFPVVWSIRHLQEASKTDGKAAINLNKLKLFRHFYILVVAYIYFTRVIGLLLKITLPFRYGWMMDLFHEVFLLVFFVSTGYKFRPTMDNPYLQVPLDSDDEEEIEMDEVLTKTGNMETVVRVNQGRSESSSKTAVKQRESSHEYD